MSELLKNSNGVPSSSRSDLVLQEVHVCDICAGAGREDSLAICSRCSDGAEHIYCMRERMDKVPSGDWLCEQCQFGIQIEGRKTVDIEAIPKMNSFGQDNSGSNGCNKKPRAKLSDDENRVGNGSTPKTLGKRQSEGVKVFQDKQGDRGISETRTPAANSGSKGRNKKSLSKLSDDENRVGNGSTSKVLGKRQSDSVEVFQDMQGDRGISVGSIGCPASETRTLEANSGSNGRNKKSRAKLSDDENRVDNGSTAKILGKRQSDGVEVFQDMQGERGLSAGSIECPASETRTPELTSLSSVGRVQHLEEKGAHESQRTCIPDLNSTLVDDDFIFSGERLFLPVAVAEVKRSDGVGGDFTVSGERPFIPVAEEKVKGSDGSSAPNVNSPPVDGDFTFSGGSSVVVISLPNVKSSAGSSAPDVNSPPVVGDFTFSGERPFIPVEEVKRSDVVGDFTFSVPVAEEEVKRSDGSSAPNVNRPQVGGGITFCGERLFLPESDEEVKRSGESSALNLNLEAEEAAATKGGEDELSLSLSLPFPDAGTTRPPF